MTNSMLRILSGVACTALLAAAASVTHAQGKVTVEEHVNYLNHPNNIRMSNGTVELILSTDYGPRIMRYAFAGSGDNGNVFATLNHVAPLKTDLGSWYIRGGTRFWHAPEGIPRTYVPDNTPIQYKIDGSSVTLIEPTEKATGIQKEATITLAPEGTEVTVTMKLINHNLWPISYACWMLSAMHPGGKAIYPQEPFASHDVSLLPARPVAGL